MNLGAHVSIAKSLDLAVDRASNLDADSIQIFPSSPRQWLAPDYSEQIVDKFIEKRKKLGLKNVFIHAIYLVNLASPNAAVRNKSILSLEKAVELQVKLRADGVVLHPGSRQNSDKQSGIASIAGAISKILEENPDGKVFFEFNAGGGNAIGSSFQELHNLIKMVGLPRQTGICLDTCHLFVDGYRFDQKNLAELISSLQLFIELPNLKLIHLNDSRFGYNSHRDIHADLGKGKIGWQPLVDFVNHPKINNLPIILETPALKRIDQDSKNEYLRTIKDKIAAY